MLGCQGGGGDDSRYRQRATASWRRRNRCGNRFGFRLSLLTRHLLPADLAELFAADDRLDGGANAVFVRLQLVAHFGNERAVGEQHAAAERIAEQLSTELFQERIAPFREQEA